MAMFGRESVADRRRVERFHQWWAARSPMSVLSVAAGVLAVVDFFTVVIGIAAGGAAIGLGISGLRELRGKPELVGQRWCVAGIVLGVVGIAASLGMWLIVYPWLAARAGG